MLTIALPRIRGDRPLAVKLKALGKKATPHTRGTTLIKYVRYPALGGYPAYAGIDH